jgi:hypothetical protein
MISGLHLSMRNDARGLKNRLAVLERRCTEVLPRVLAALVSGLPLPSARIRTLRKAQHSLHACLRRSLSLTYSYSVPCVTSGLKNFILRYRAIIGQRSPNLLVPRTEKSTVHGDHCRRSDASCDATLTTRFSQGSQSARTLCFRFGCISFELRLRAH